MNQYEDELRDDDFLPDDVCSGFRTKTMTLNTEHRRCAEEVKMTANTAYFYCLKTMREHGPDEDDVTPDFCRPGRDCYCHDAGLA